MDGASKLAAFIRAMRALREAGAMPQVFGTPTVTDGMKYTHLVSTASVGTVMDLRLLDEKNKARSRAISVSGSPGQGLPFVFAVRRFSRGAETGISASE